MLQAETGEWPLVSIGLPTFNRPVELQRMLECLATQTYPNTEIIIVDNHSTDERVQQVGEAAATARANVRFFRNKENLGVVGNAIEALKYARGDYFCWVSDDDWRAPEFIATLVEAMQRDPSASLACSDYREVLPNGEDAPGYPKTHRRHLRPFTSPSLLRRLLAFYWQDERNGKQNLFYSIFKTESLRNLDLQGISRQGTRLNTDSLIVLNLLQRGHAALCDDMLFTLTCENRKHYLEQGYGSSRGVFKTVLSFLGDQFRTHAAYVENCRSRLIRALMHALLVPRGIKVGGERLVRRFSDARSSQVASGARVGAKQCLPNVTLVAMATRNVEETLKALKFSMSGIEYGQVKLLSHYMPHGLPPEIEFHRIPKIKDIDEWSYRIVYDLGDYIDTDFALLVHADGFVVNPDSWRDEFLSFDYIGAPWPLPKDDFSYRDKDGNIVRVGNSVSIRSKRLLDLPKKIGIPWEADHGFFNEDGFISVKNKHVFEAHGCRFAGLEDAKYFSHEAMIPEIKGIRPFVFHKWAGSNAGYPRF